MAPAVAGVLWGFLFNPSIGIVAYAAQALSASTGTTSSTATRRCCWWSSPPCWKQISYNFLFFLAGLQSIPRSLIEAAAIDGAGPGAALLDHRLPAALADHASSCW